MKIDLEATAELLQVQDDILLLTHSNPDGDALGCAYALAHALHAKGKRAQVKCPDMVKSIYDFMKGDLPRQNLNPSFVVSVDVADTHLLGKLEEEYKDRIDLCIDHHGSNTFFAKYSHVNAEAAANAEVVYLLLELMDAEITPIMADCLYAGLSTDSGCFRYANTTAQTHRVAAKLMEAGARASELDRLFFETKTRSYVVLERLALENLKLYFSGKCAIMPITQEMYRISGSNESETERISGVPREIEGVLAGATMKEQPDGTFKVSLRTYSPVNASDICGRLGGGGHNRAAGCVIRLPQKEAVSVLLDSIKQSLIESEVL